MALQTIAILLGSGLIAYSLANLLYKHGYTLKICMMHLPYTAHPNINISYASGLYDHHKTAPL